MKTTITTLSGSTYLVREDEEGKFWLTADHIPNPDSVDIRGREWEIDRPLPWPPVIGESILLQSIYPYDPDTAERPPGGGKFTSPVQDFLFSP